MVCAVDVVWMSRRIIFIASVSTIVATIIAAAAIGASVFTGGTSRIGFRNVIAIVMLTRIGIRGSVRVRVTAATTPGTTVITSIVLSRLVSPCVCTISGTS